VQSAWQRAQEIGVYHFATEIVQTTHPAPAIANFGRSSRQDTVYLEGDVDTPARTILMSLWQNGGSVLNARDGIEVRIEGDRAYTRQIGGAWQETADFSSAFAPGGDLMAYLAGAKNVRKLGTETRQLPGASGESVTYTRYAFNVDGPAFARHLRDQLEAYLHEKGELPLRMTLDTPRLYLDMTGQGEIWIDDRGLPLRMVVHLDYPEQANGERIEADIKTDFTGFAPQLEIASGQGSLTAITEHLGLPSTPSEFQWAGQQAALAIGFVALFLALLYCRRARKLYTILVVAIILSLVVGPLLDTYQVHAFSQRWAARQAEQAQQQQAYDDARDIQENLLASDWDPHHDPLESLQAGKSASAPVSNLQPSVSFSSFTTSATEDDTDSDADGLPDSIDPDPGNADSDVPSGDGLSDGVEVLRLGTDPLEADTDGDGIDDNVEIEGFLFDSQRWYLDPKNPDTNGDGQVDTTECPDLVGVTSAGTLSCPDTDGDGVPDIFDDDNDGDGVPDQVDLTPAAIVDRDGIQANAANPNYFSDEYPFTFQVDGLATDLPVFVDLQLRPKEADHLSYALNVLDWPSDDEGQIQHINSTTRHAPDPYARDRDAHRFQRPGSPGAHHAGRRRLYDRGYLGHGAHGKRRCR
jgi:hypothetical protein